ncbi:short-chain dehydrogenase [Thermaurantimonas aggregans]|uniref:Short-chain dehydrogenase n=1 Tax=Thermaurantimonas aggregans TaxID=2173829 RepID=A0A401XNC9_9FLAO|nr:SDR family oxidoreductase [Thermaurantimonas aggregans]MCX8149636.1 SDR family oxidoreductase [Thermaurantimonas aggregans]GCD78519.1 short-chain dehydrogenase [Thermaurantimonas aggregans]
MKISGKVWAVTGAASGIGLALSREILSRGGKVALIDIADEALRQAEKTLNVPSSISIHKADVSDIDRIRELPSEIIQKHGQIDGLVNNAGIIQPFVDFVELPDEKILKILQVNLISVVHLTRIFYPHIKARPEAHLVNVSSMGGVFPFPGQTWYGATKSAVKLLTEGMYAELLNSSIKVTLVIPGAVKTNIVQNSGVSMSTPQPAKNQKTLTAEEAALKICNAIEKNQFRLLLGREAKMLDVLYRLMPERSIGIIARRMKKIF